MLVKNSEFEVTSSCLERSKACTCHTVCQNKVDGFDGSAMGKILK